MAIGNLATESVYLPSGYGTYICGAGSNYTFATSGQQFSWTNDVQSLYEGAASSSVGHQSSNICTASTAGAENNGMSMIGIAVNAPSNSYTLYTASDPTTGTKTSRQSNPTDASLSYTVTGPGEFTIAVITSGFFGLNSITLPSGCTELSFVNNSDTYESTYMAACYGQSAGTHVVDMFA